MPPSSRSGVDLEGDYLVPGVVELHTDVLERHALPRPGVQWPELPAVLAYDSQLIGAGITTVLDSLAIGYLVDTAQRPRDPGPLIAAIRTARGAGMLRADHYLHMRCEVSTALVVRDFEPFADDPLVRLVSLMDHAPGQRQFVNLDTYRTYYQRKLKMTDAEFDRFCARRRQESERNSEHNRRTIAASCRDAGVALASHDDATAEHVEEAVELGVSLAEFPTTVEAARLSAEAGLQVLMGAPNVVRGGSPTAADRVLATRLGAAAVEHLARGQHAVVIGTLCSEIAGRDLAWFFEVYVRQPFLPRLDSEVANGVLRLRWKTPKDLPFALAVPVVVDGKEQRVEMPGGRGELRVGSRKYEPWTVEFKNPGYFGKRHSAVRVEAASLDRRAQLNLHLAEIPCM